HPAVECTTPHSGRSTAEAEPASASLCSCHCWEVWPGRSSPHLAPDASCWEAWKGTLGGGKPTGEGGPGNSSCATLFQDPTRSPTMPTTYCADKRRQRNLVGTELSSGAATARSIAAAASAGR